MPYADPEMRRAYERTRDHAGRTRDRKRARLEAGRCYRCGDESPTHKACAECRHIERLKRAPYKVHP